MPALPKCSATGKVRHPNQAAALILKRKLKNKALNVYRCRRCEGWHLGNSQRDCDTQARIDQLLGR